MVAPVNVQNIANVADFPPFTIPGEWYAAARARAAVLLVPAMGIPAGYYRRCAEACASRGFNVLLPELPGTGTSHPLPSRHADYGYRDLAERYVPALVDETRRRCGDAPVVLLGHSIGAHAGMLAALLDRITIAALVTVAAGNIHYRNWTGPDAGKVRLAAWLVAGLSHALGRVPGQYFGLGGAQPRKLMREWSLLIRRGSYSHIADPLPDVLPVPALCVGYERDFMAPRRSVVQMAHMLGADMEWVAVDWPGNPHSSWARFPEKTLALVDDWLVARKLVTPL